MKLMFTVIPMLKHEDVDIQEFSDEIDQWIIDELKNIGCDTAKSVLELDKELGKQNRPGRRDDQGGNSDTESRIRIKIVSLL